MGKEQGSFREKVGHGVLWGGIIAAVIGFITMPELIIPGAVLAGAGAVVSKTGKNK